MAGIKLAAGATVTFFGAVDPGAEAVVVTSSGSSDALPGTQPGSLKVTPVRRVPRQGARHGRRARHRFLKGEDTLVLAWVGAQPARACGAERRARSSSRTRPAGATGPARPTRRSSPGIGAPVR